LRFVDREVATLLSLVRRPTQEPFRGWIVAGPNGEQVVIVFTMTPKQADRLGTRDLSLAANIDFPNK